MVSSVAGEAIPAVGSKDTKGNMLSIPFDNTDPPRQLSVTSRAKNGLDRHYFTHALGPILKRARLSVRIGLILLPRDQPKLHQNPPLILLPQRRQQHLPQILVLHRHPPRRAPPVALPFAYPLRDTLDHVFRIAGQDDLVEPFAVPHPEAQSDDGGAQFGTVGRLGTVAFEPVGEVVVSAPFDAVARASLRGAVVGTGAVDVD